MRKSNGVAVAVVASLGIVLFACRGETANLGGDGDGGTTSAGQTSVTTEPTCDGASYAGTPDDGSGHNVLAPPTCSAADGTTQTFASTAAVTQAITGLWTACGGDEWYQALGGMGGMNYVALQLNGDGTFVAYSTNSSGASFEDSVGAAEDGGDGNAPLQGTFQIVDASATLGAGTYQIRLEPQTGGAVYVAQVVVLGSPTKLRFVFSSGPTLDDLAPSLPLSFRKGVCNYGSIGPQYAFTSATDEGARLQGSWVWCAGPALGLLAGISGVGIELPGDGTWYALVADGSGNIARATAGEGHGTVNIDSNNEFGTLGLTYASTGDGTRFNPILSACASTPTLSMLWPLSAPLADQPVLQKSPTEY